MNEILEGAVRRVGDCGVAVELQLRGEMVVQDLELFVRLLPRGHVLVQAGRVRVEVVDWTPTRKLRGQVQGRRSWAVGEKI